MPGQIKMGQNKAKGNAVKSYDNGAKPACESQSALNAVCENVLSKKDLKPLYRQDR